MDLQKKQKTRSPQNKQVQSVSKQIHKNSATSNQDSSSSSDGFRKRCVKIWTPDEDKLLNESHKQFIGNWKNIAESIPDRNPSQCSQRWKRINPNRDKLRKPWCEEEDKIVERLVRKYGKNWRLIEDEMEGRSGKQIRERWINKLDININSDPFSQNEDQIILQQYQLNGPKWSNISKFLTGRPENMVKNRFYSYVKRLYINDQGMHSKDLYKDDEYDRDLESDIEQENQEQADSQQIYQQIQSFAAQCQLATIQSVNEEFHSIKPPDHEGGAYNRGGSLNNFSRMGSGNINSLGLGGNTLNKIHPNIFHHGSMSLEQEPGNVVSMGDPFATDCYSCIAVPMPQLEQIKYSEILNPNTSDIFNAFKPNQFY